MTNVIDCGLGVTIVSFQNKGIDRGYKDYKINNSEDLKNE